MNPYVASALVAARAEDAHRAAARARLAELARCCRPSAWRSTASRAVAAVRRLAAAGRLQPVDTYCACA